MPPATLRTLGSREVGAPAPSQPTSESAGHPFSAEQLAAQFRQRDRTLARRAKGGTWAYAALVILLGGVTPLGTEYPLLVSVVLLFNIVLGFCRWALAEQFDLVYTANPRLARGLLMTTTLAVGLAWGAFSSFAVIRFGMTSTTLLVLVCTAGLLAGAMTLMCISMRLHLAYAGAVLAPLTIAGAVHGGADGYSLSAIFLFYFMFLSAEGRRLGREYWLSLRRSEIVEHARRQAEEASRAKSEFLANMSHEIRTPMNGVLGMTEAALAGELSDTQRENISLVRSSALALLGVINDILDFSKIEAGKLTLARRPLRLRSSLGDLIRALAGKAREKDLALVLDVGPSVPDALLGDGSRLRQVLVNLIGNAIKFTNEGKVVVKVRTASRSDDRVELEFAVRDTGVGIPIEDQEVIFAAFEQADTSSTRAHGGTGLGLSISASLVELMGGRMRLESEVGVGSTFSFTAVLNVRAEDADESDDAPAIQPPVPSSAPLGTVPPGLRVLVAEDNPVNILVVRRLLERAGCQVTTAPNGRRAVEALAQASYDVVLMDVQMPEMDGLQATAEIRGREAHGAARTPIIALTAHAMRGDRANCLEAGMDAYLSKPIVPEKLLAVIRNVTEAGRDGNGQCATA